MPNQYGGDFTVEEIQGKFLERGYTPMFNHYKNAHEKLPCINKDGYFVLLSYDKLQQGRTPQPFYINNPYTIDNIKTFIKNNKREDVLVSETFIQANTKGLDFICRKGHQYTMLWRHYKDGSGCPHCNNYKGEQKIIHVLDELNIEYEYQKSYDNLRGVANKRSLSYDFYLPKYNLLIEYQGKQHENPVEFFGGEEHFKVQQEHDKRKREYAVYNNIELLEIWYYEFDNIEKILKGYVCSNGVLFSV